MLSNHPNCLGGNGPSASSDLIGDVDGPASATDNAVARFDGTTGKLIQNSVVTIDDTTGAIAGASSLTSPAATGLTLGGGSSGASLVLGQGATAASSTITNTGTGSLSVVNGDYYNVLTLSRNSSATNTGTTLVLRSKDAGGTYVDIGAFFAAKSAATIGAVDSFLTWSTRRAGTLTDAMALTATGNLVIGPTTSETGLTGAGGLKIASSTAGAASAGALVVTGGLSAGNNGNASFFGGNASISGPAKATFLIDSTDGATNGSALAFASSGSYKWIVKSASFTDGSLFTIGTATGVFTSTPVLSLNYSTAAATFAGTVSYSGALKEGSDNVISSSGTALLFGNSATWTETRLGSTSASGIVTLYAGNAERMRIASTGAITMNAYGAGAATFDSSGNITSVSDARLKNITGTFTKGLAEIVKLTPKLYTWKPETGLVTDDINATLIAQDLIAAGLSEAVSTYRTVPVMEDDVQSAEDIAAGKLVTQHPKLDADGKAVTQRVDSNYSVSDRTVIAALVNAVKELKAEIDALKAAK